MLLSPNEVHADQIFETASLMVPVFVDKPLTTTRVGMRIVEQAIEINPQLYCSDFYPDVRAIPLLEWLGRRRDWLPADVVEVEGDRELWDRGRAALGTCTRIRAVQTEGAGEAATFGSRKWLWDPIHGGVLWDLAYHYFALWHRGFDEEIALTEAALETTPDAPGPELAETRAELRYRSASGTDIEIEVGKYYPNWNERSFTMECMQGTATMEFEKCNYVTVKDGRSSCRGVLRGDYYRHVAHGFRRFVDSHVDRPHGFDSAKWVVERVLSIKEAVPVAEAKVEGSVTTAMPAEDEPHRPAIMSRSGGD